MKQSFCSFLCCWSQGDDQFEDLAKQLPSYRTDCAVADFHGGRFFLSLPDANGLHRSKLASNENYLWFVHGDFYAKPDLPKLAECVSSHGVDLARLSEFAMQLNGVFAGFILDTQTGECHSFSDRFGFSRVFVATTNDATVISSSIWPLVRRDNIRGVHNVEAIHDTLMFGFPLLGDTAYENISMPRAGTILSRSKQSSMSTRYFDFRRKPRERSTEQLAAELREISKEHCTSLQDADPNFTPALALSGGKDSRVALSGLLESGIKPKCYVGFERTSNKDSDRGVRVAEVTSCPVDAIDYSKRTDEDFADGIVLIDGGRNGTWTMNLARVAAEQGCSGIYYGTTGDVLSGGWAAPPRSFASVDALAEFTMNDYVEYKMPASGIAQSFSNRSLDDVRQRFRSGYIDDLSDDIADTALAFRIMTRNFRRIRTFTHGSSVYATPIHFFHDTRVSDFYWSLPYDHLLNQKSHSALCSMHTSQLGKVPATSYPFGVALEPLFVPVAKALMPGSLKEMLRRMVHGRQTKRKVYPERLTKVLDHSSAIELSADHFAAFAESEPDAALVEQRLLMVATMLDPTELLNDSRLFGEKTFEPLGLDG